MALIKSANVPSQAAPFSLRDIENQARAILLRAREQAEAVLAEAQELADQLRSRGHAEGVAEGRRDGFKQGQQEGAAAGAQQALTQHTSQLATLVTALTTACGEMDASRANLEASGLREVVNLAIAIARRVSKRQGLIEPQVLTENLKDAMKLVSHAADVRIALHPTQKKVLEAALPSMRLAWPNLQHVELVEDASLAPGGCRIYTARGVVDADLDAQLDRVIDDLLPVEREPAL